MPQAAPGLLNTQISLWRIPLFLVPAGQSAVVKRTHDTYTRASGRRAMSILVERSDLDPQTGYQYYVAFNVNGTFEEEEVQTRVPVEVALSLSETGDLADFNFEIPKVLRNKIALNFINDSDNARYVDPRLYVSFPGMNGDAVTLAAGRLELDLTGRIIGLEILWAPTDLNTHLTN
jgi:hypothetical protein